MEFTNHVWVVKHVHTQHVQTAKSPGILVLFNFCVRVCDTVNVAEITVTCQLNWSYVYLMWN